MSPPPTLLHIFPTFNVGGAQMRFTQIANHFGRRYRHRVISMDGGVEASSRLDATLDVTITSLHAQKRDTLKNVVEFRRFLQRMRPQLLVTSNWGTIEWALARWGSGVPHIHMEDGFGPEEADAQYPRRVWTRRIALRKSVVVLPSRTLYGIARNVWKLDEATLTCVPNGIDTTRFACKADLDGARRLGIRVDRPVVGTLGALRPEKNLLRLLEAFRLLRSDLPAQLVIVGDGQKRCELESAAKKLGISADVLFTGACPNPEKVLPLFTVFALSSDTEQMPLSVLEAMAACRPIASTDVGDVRSMVSSLNAEFVTGKDAGQLAAAMRRIIENPALAKAVGTANRHRVVESFDQAVMFEAYGRIFDAQLAFARMRAS